MNDTDQIPAKFSAEADIAFTRHGSAIDVRLTRPKALNALTHNMAKALYAGLRVWADDNTVSHVVISAETGDKHAFCAGGDIRDLHEGFKKGTPRYAFFRDEYRLNEAIATFPKPYISLMDGIVMGGGAGISMHGSHRIVTENTKFAMPEVGIGLIPDVGGSYILPRMKNNFGMFLGLTGLAVGPDVCLEAGIATHFCPANEIDVLRAKLLRSTNPLDELQSLCTTPPSNLLSGNANRIESAFSAITLPELFELLELQIQPNPWLSKALERMKAASPLSLCLAFELLKRGRKLSLRECLVMEYQQIGRAHV